jgi:hypothetical protein
LALIFGPSGFGTVFAFSSSDIVQGYLLCRAMDSSRHWRSARMLQRHQRRHHWLAISLLAGRWGGDDTVSTTSSSNLQFFDNDLITAQMNALAEQDMKWRLFFSRNSESPSA